MQAQSQSYAGVDFSQYASWPVVTTPSGGVYYKVPGTGLLYSPFLSNLKPGEVQLLQDPTEKNKEKQEQKEREEQAYEQAMQNASPMGQMLPIAGAVAGTVGGPALVNWLTASSTPKGPVPLPDGSVGVMMGDGTLRNGAGQIVSGAAGATPTAGQAFTGGIPFTAAEQSGLANFGTSAGASVQGAPPAMPNLLEINPLTSGGYFSGLGPAGSEFAGMGTLGQGALLAGGAFGAYNIGNALFNEEKMGTLTGATSGAGLGALVGSMAIPIPGFGTLIGGAIGALAGGVLGEVGHSENYYHGKARESIINKVSGGSGVITLPTANGQSITVTAKDLRHNPDLYNLNAGVTPEQHSQGMLLVGIDPNKSTEASVTEKQLSTFFANMIAKGVSPDTIRQAFADPDAVKTQAQMQQAAPQAPLPPQQTGPAPAPQQTPPGLMPKGLLPSGQPAQPGAAPLPQMTPGQAFVQGPAQVANQMIYPAGQQMFQYGPTIANRLQNAYAQQFGLPAPGAAPAQTPGVVPPSNIEVMPKTPPRSMTSSPGISKEGRRLSAEELGRMLGKRMNGRR